MRFETARDYDKFAVAQKFAAKKLIEILLEFAPKHFDNAYEIGAGSGLLTREFLAEFDCGNLILNDLYESEFMSEFSSQIGDISALEIPKRQNIVLSSSVFQWIDDLNALCESIYLALEPDGLCAFSTFVNGTLNQLESFTKQGLKYVEKSRIQSIFARKFEILFCEQFSFLAEFASLKELLNHLKQTGVNNLRGQFKLNRASLTAMDRHFGGNYALDYNFVILICKKERN